MPYSVPSRTAFWDFFLFLFPRMFSFRLRSSANSACIRTFSHVADVEAGVQHRHRKLCPCPSTVEPRPRPSRIARLQTRRVVVNVKEKDLEIPIPVIYGWKNARNQ